jgi:transcriptional regulator GlxA family with amidase domain
LSAVDTGADACSSSAVASSAKDEDLSPRTVVFVLVPRFSMIAFSSALEPLRIANRLHGTELYRWVVLSPDGNPAQASNGIAVNVDGTIGAYELASDGRRQSDMVLVCGGLGSERYKDAALDAWLRRQERQSAYIGALCTGSCLLAAAGLLDGFKCVIHWESLDGFIETYPEIEVSADLFAVDRNRITCAGGTAALDMILYLIAKQHGKALATQVVEQCLADRMRNPHDHQRLSLCARLGIHSPNVLKAIEIMEAHIEDPISQERIALLLGLSCRQHERLFRRHIRMPPAHYYLELRLKRARHLLLQSEMSILEVALACGFVSASHFSKCYRDLYGKSPSEERRTLLRESVPKRLTIVTESGLGDAREHSPFIGPSSGIGAATTQR